MKKYLFTLIFAATVISAATAQKTSKEDIEDAITYARNVAFVLKAKPQDSTKLAFISYAGNSADTGIEPKRASYKAFGKTYLEPFRLTSIQAGPFVLFVPRSGSIVEKTASGIRYETDTLTFNFEIGKYYTIDSRVDKENKIEFSIKETDIMPYLSYQTANPNRLEGTWIGEGKRLLNTFINKYHFDSNIMEFEGDSKTPNPTFVVKGKFMYNENTIIFFPENAYHKGKEVKNFNNRADRSMYIWYYTLINNELHIEEGNPFLIGIQSWVNTGNFQKDNQ